MTRALVSITATEVAKAMRNDGEFALRVLGILSTSVTPAALLSEGLDEARAYQGSLVPFLRGMAEEMKRRIG